MQRVARNVLASTHKSLSAGFRGGCSSKVARSMSTVAEHTIRLNFVDVDGNRASVPGRIGQTLLDVAVAAGIDLEGACGGGGGPTEVPSSYNHVLPEETAAEQEGLGDVWEDEVSKTSRLACMITLRKEHDGMSVYVPDAPPVDVI